VQCIKKEPLQVERSQTDTGKGSSKDIIDKACSCNIDRNGKRLIGKRYFDMEENSS